MFTTTVPNYKIRVHNLKFLDCKFCNKLMYVLLFTWNKWKRRETCTLHFGTEVVVTNWHNKSRFFLLNTNWEIAKVAYKMNAGALTFIVFFSHDFQTIWSKSNGELTENELYFANTAIKIYDDEEIKLILLFSDLWAAKNKKWHCGLKMVANRVWVVADKVENYN